MILSIRHALCVRLKSARGRTMKGGSAFYLYMEKSVQAVQAVDHGPWDVPILDHVLLRQSPNFADRWHCNPISFTHWLSAHWKREAISKTPQGYLQYSVVKEAWDQAKAIYRVICFEQSVFYKSNCKLCSKWAADLFYVNYVNHTMTVMLNLRNSVRTLNTIDRLAFCAYAFRSR